MNKVSGCIGALDGEAVVVAELEDVVHVDLALELGEAGEVLEEAGLVACLLQELEPGGRHAAQNLTLFGDQTEMSK